jgi:Fe-S-cluster containining protein
MMNKFIRACVAPIRKIFGFRPRSDSTTKALALQKSEQIINSIPQSLIVRIQNFTAAVPRSNDSTDTLLKKLYQITDELNSYIAPKAACGKGCSHCCYVRVPITDIEAAFITKNTGVSHTKVRSSAEPPLSFYSKTTPCALLASDGTCSVYSSRPFSCRTYNNIDDDEWYCLFENWQVENRPMFGSKPLDEAYKAICNRKANVQTDIRKFFP